MEVVRPEAPDSPYILKLFDRRFARGTRKENDIPFWTPAIESQYREFVRSGQVQTFSEIVNNVGGWDDDKEWSVEENETYGFELFADFFNVETKAYNLLADLQGGCVPRLYATVDLPIHDTSEACSGLTTDHAPLPPSRFLSIPGIILEKIKGYSLFEVASHAPKESWKHICDSAVEAINAISDHGILNRDVTPRNVMVEQLQEKRIDFSEERSNLSPSKPFDPSSGSSSPAKNGAIVNQEPTRIINSNKTEIKENEGLETAIDGESSHSSHFSKRSLGLIRDVIEKTCALFYPHSSPDLSVAPNNNINESDCRITKKQRHLPAKTGDGLETDARTSSAIATNGRDVPATERSFSRSKNGTEIENEEAPSSGNASPPVKPRVVIIDFGLCSFRTEYESEAAWRRAKCQQNEAGAIGIVMDKAVLKSDAYKYKSSQRYGGVNEWDEHIDPWVVYDRPKGWLPLEEAQALLLKEAQEKADKEAQESAAEEAQESRTKEAQESHPKEAEEPSPAKAQESPLKEAQNPPPKKARESHPKKAQDSSLEKSQESTVKGAEESSPAKAQESPLKEAQNPPPEKARESPLKEAQDTPREHPHHR